MKIQFESNQQYQLDAINAIVDIFDGQPLAQGQFEIRLDTSFSGLLSGLGTGNSLVLSEETLAENVRKVQERNGVPVSRELDGMNFSIEMETGTGKTYVYLRTIYELNAKYGFTKFIIVVPSVAIREGVLKNLQLTAEHFRAIYGNQPCGSWVYDSKRVSSLRQFATSNQLQILVINIDAFNKKTNNVIHKENDKLSGYRPIEFIQATNPIVIMDEPQNMEAETAKEAISSLNPLCTLRYSATHRNLYNLLYRLDPVRAYDMKLVKRIEVHSVMDDGDYNLPYIHVNDIKATKAKITAYLTIDINRPGGLSRKTVSISKNGEDLYDRSNERDAYKGFIVDHIDASSGYIAFTNGIRLSIGQTQGRYTSDFMRTQIRETVEKHLEKELRIYEKLPEGKRLKVLSLFFIDRVANYVEANGCIRQWFIETYTELSKSPRYKCLGLPEVDKVHNGYFAQSKGVAKDTNGNTAADDEAYGLIMKDKERLLSLKEPVRFIFSHSALREGWDNPNVFQICTLNETKSEIKKRQEIGRGLRLPIDETGVRVFDPAINRLTVVVNESYLEFAKALQTQIEEECGVSFEGRINNAKEKKKANLKKGWRLNEDFRELWERIKYKTRYSVKYDTQSLIIEASRAVHNMDPVMPPKLRVMTVGLEIGKEGVTQQLLASRDGCIEAGSMPIPDLLGYLQRETELTRSTLAEILIQSGRLGDVSKNPQQFLDLAVAAIKRTLDQLILSGIKYERIAGDEYEMLLFEENEIEGYIAHMLDVNKSIYDAIEFDSEIEERFAQNLDAREDIKLFIKLPRWFRVATPLGDYNPDWAIVKQEVNQVKKLYLVKETKGTQDQMKLRPTEWGKIKCGMAHFNELGVDFQLATSGEDV